MSGEASRKRTLTFRVTRIGFALSAIAFACALHFDPTLAGIVFQSDALYPSALFLDLIGPAGLAGWSLPPAPYLFPDLPIVFLLQWIGGVRFAMLGTALLMFGLLYGSFRLLFGSIEQDGNTGSFAILDGTFLLLSFYITLFDRESFIYLILPGHHAGVLILTNLSLYLLLRLLNGGHEISLAMLCIAVFASAFSDSLYTLTFVLPSIAVVSTAALQRGISIRRASAIILAIFIAYSCSAMATRMIRDSGIVFIPDINVIHHLRIRISGGMFIEEMLRSVVEFFKQNPVAFVWPPLIAACLMGFYHGLKGEGRVSESMLLFYLTAAILNFSGMLFTGLHFNNSIFPLRYTLFIPIFPILFLALGALRFKPLFRLAESLQKNRLFPAVSLFLIVFLFGATLFRINSNPDLDDAVSCIDSHTDEYSLRRGVSDYWNAKRITLLSKRGLFVNQIDRDLRPYHWISNIEWFLPANGKPMNFIVTDRLDSALIRNRFGEPAAIFRCAETTTYVYNRPSDTAFREYWNERKLRGEFLPPSAIRWNERGSKNRN